MAKWNELLEIRNGRNQKAVENPNGLYPIYGSGGVMGYADKYLCPENTVVVGRKGSINKPIYVSKKFWNVDTAFGLIVDDTKLVSKFLYYFCIQFNFEKLSTTVTIPSLTKSNLLNMSMPLPSLDEQRKIAATLDAAADLLKLRKQQLDELDKLIQSVFYDMFRIYFSQEDCYELLPKVCTFIDYRGKTPKKSESGVPFITAKNVRGNQFSIEPREYISEETYSQVMTRGYPQENDILFTTEAPLGNVCLIPNCYEKFAVGQRIIVMQPNKQCITSEYLEFALASEEFQHEMLKRSSGSTVKGIRSKELVQLSVPVPPFHLQKRFSDIVIKIEEQKTLVQQSIDETQALFDSLMSEYFE